MMPLRYDEQSPCTRCGSSMEDCDCCAEYELRSSMSALGVSTESGTYYEYVLRDKYTYETVPYELAMLNRMLREFGY